MAVYVDLGGGCGRDGTKWPSFIVHRRDHNTGVTEMLYHVIPVSVVRERIGVDRGAVLVLGLE